MLPSGAHVKIGDDEFLIDKDVQDHYIRRWYDLDDQEQDEITGEPGKKKRNPESLFWSYTDWAGGEGNRVYNPDEPDRYSIGYELNPRLRGQLTMRPRRRVTTVAAKEVSDRPVMTVGNGAVWLGGGYGLHFSTSGPITWTSKATSATPASDKVGLRSLSTSYRITAMAGDNDYVYYSAFHSGSSGSRVTMRAIMSDAALAEVVQAQATGVAPYAGLALMKGDLYAWTGRKLHVLEISNVTSGDTDGLTGTDQIRKVYDTGVDPSNSNVFSSTWWADMVATENSVVMFYSNDGVSKVYEYKKGVGRPIWSPPYGFTIKGMTYANGVVYFSGHWGGDENAIGRGSLYALPLNSYTPFPVAAIRDHVNENLQMQEMHTSYGYQVVTVAQNTGRIFIYDAKEDGLSMLDDMGTDAATAFTDDDVDGLVFGDNYHRVAGSITFGAYRYFSVYEKGGSGAGNYQIVVYDDDRPEQVQTGLIDSAARYEFAKLWFETPRWDYAYPLDKKTLIGFHLNFKPLISGQTIDVTYDHDEDGVVSTTSGWTALTQITSATTGASVGRVFLPVSLTGAQKKFITLKFRVKLAATSGVIGPTLYAVTAEAKCTRKRREWEMVVRVKDEQSRTRMSDGMETGGKIGDVLETMVENGDVAVLLDGYRYQEEGLYGTPYSTHNIVVKQAEWHIEKPGQGYMRLLLRSVDAADA